VEVEFADDDLRRLYEERDFRLPGIGPELTKAFRKRVQFIVSAADRRDLYAMRSNHFEKLRGDREGQHSLRVTDQWRLIVRLEQLDRGGEKVVILTMDDYH